MAKILCRFHMFTASRQDRPRADGCRKTAQAGHKVGNFNVGRNGKTPVVMKLADKLVKEGLKPAILTRGYRRKNRAIRCLIASDGKGSRESAENAGDEPFLIAEKVPARRSLWGRQGFVRAACR